VWKTVKPFANGGASGMLATCVIQPIGMLMKEAAFEACRMSAGLRNCCRDDWTVVGNHFIEQSWCLVSSLSF
jgi:hypothetical protein